MPSGNTHSLIAGGASILAGGALLYFQEPMDAVILIVSIMVGDLWLSPDLDGAASNAKRRWWILKWIWRFYERLPHRSPLSHWPILADILRLAYLIAMANLAWLTICVIRFGAEGFPRAMVDAFARFQWEINFAISHQDQCLIAFGGFCLATALHGAADAIVSESGKMVDYVVPKSKTRRLRIRH